MFVQFLYIVLDLHPYKYISSILCTRSSSHSILSACSISDFYNNFFPFNDNINLLSLKYGYESTIYIRKSERKL